MSAPVDWTKPVQTRDGRAVRVLCTDARSRYPVVALVKDDEGESVDTFTAEGWALAGSEAGSDRDLVNVPERATWFLNWYAPAISNAAVCLSRGAADEYALSNRVAVLRITTENGVPIAVAIERVAP